MKPNTRRRLELYTALIAALLVLVTWEAVHSHCYPAVQVLIRIAIAIPAWLVLSAFCLHIINPSRLNIRTEKRKETEE